MAVSWNSNAGEELEIYRQERASSAKREFETHKQRRKGLDEKSFYLVSLKPPMSWDRLMGKLRPHQLTLTGVYVCFENGGVAAYHFDSAVSQAKQLADFEATLGAQRYGRVLGVSPSVSNEVAPSTNASITYCGFDARMDIVTVEALEQSLKSDVAAIEVTNEKRRRMPINWGK